jgi:hypothetical protein
MAIFYFLLRPLHASAAAGSLLCAAAGQVLCRRVTPVCAVAGRAVAAPAASGCCPTGRHLCRNMHHWAQSRASQDGLQPPTATVAPYPSSVQVPGTRRPRVDDGTTLIRQDDNQFRQATGWVTQGEGIGRHGRHNFGQAVGNRVLKEARAAFDNSNHDWISSLRGIHLPNTYRRMSSKKRQGNRGGGAAVSRAPSGHWEHGFESPNTVKQQMAIIAAQNQALLQNLDEVKSTVKALQDERDYADEKLEAIEYLTKMQLSESRRQLQLRDSGDDTYGAISPHHRQHHPGPGGPGLDQRHPSLSPLSHSDAASPRRPPLQLAPEVMPQLRLRPNRRPGDRSIVVDSSADAHEFLPGMYVCMCVWRWRPLFARIRPGGLRSVAPEVL